MEHRQVQVIALLHLQRFFQPNQRFWGQVVLASSVFDVTPVDLAYEEICAALGKDFAHAYFYKETGKEGQFYKETAAPVARDF